MSLPAAQAGTSEDIDFPFTVAVSGLAAANDNVMDQLIVEVVARGDDDIADLLVTAIYPGNSASVNPGAPAIIGQVDLVAECTRAVETDHG